MTRRVLAVCLTVAVICSCMAAPVSAAEDDSSWIELLEYSTVNGSGNNYFTYTSSGTFSLETPMRMRIARVDMLVSYTSGTVPSNVTCVIGSYTTKLSIMPISAGVARIYGVAPNTFATSATFKFESSATASSAVEVLSCRVSPVLTQDFETDSNVYFSRVTYSNGTVGAVIESGENYIVSPEDVSGYTDGFDWQAFARVYDWQKYDELTFTGHCVLAEIGSISASINNAGIPVVVNYLEPVDSQLYGQYSNNAYRLNSAHYQM